MAGQLCFFLNLAVSSQVESFVFRFRVCVFTGMTDESGKARANLRSSCLFAALRPFAPPRLRARRANFRAVRPNSRAYSLAPLSLAYLLASILSWV